MKITLQEAHEKNRTVLFLREEIPNNLCSKRAEMAGSKASVTKAPSRSFSATFTVPIGRPMKPPGTLRGSGKSRVTQKYNKTKCKVMTSASVPCPTMPPRGTPPRVQVLQESGQRSDPVTNGENGCDAPRRSRIRPAPPPLKPEPNIIRPKVKAKPRPPSPEGTANFFGLE